MQLYRSLHWCCRHIRMVNLQPSSFHTNYTHAHGLEQPAVDDPLCYLQRVAADLVAVAVQPSGWRGVL